VEKNGFQHSSKRKDIGGIDNNEANVYVVSSDDELANNDYYSVL